MRSLEFDVAAFEDLAWWIEQDRSNALRIVSMIKDEKTIPLLNGRPKMPTYSPELTLRAARNLYFAANGFKGGGYEDRWVKMKAGPFPIIFPNSHRRTPPGASPSSSFTHTDDL